MEEKSTKKFVTGFVLFAFITSLVTAGIMTYYFQQDTSKLRFELTQRYKEIKDDPYTYDSVKGKQLYQDLCLRCHGKQGRGNSMYPPLYAAKILKPENQKMYLLTVVGGLKGEIKREDKIYSGLMPHFKKIDAFDLAHVLNYVRKTFLHPQAKEINHIDTVKIQIDYIERKNPFTPLELEAASKFGK